MLDFTFRAFSTGHACLPEGGMGAIAEQLAASSPRARCACTRG
jgi:phytoene dehydrogenase-like protein